MIVVRVYDGEKICDYCRNQVVSDLARYEITDAETDFTKLPKGIWEINDVVVCASHLNDACIEARWEMATNEIRIRREFI